MKPLRMPAVFMLLAMMMTMLTGCQVPDDPVPRPSEDINVNFYDYEQEAKEFLRITEFGSPESDSYDSESSDAVSQALNMIVCDALLGYEGEESDKYGKRLFSQIEADCPDDPDPKNSLYVYEKLDGDEVDKVLSDVFNTEPDHTEKAQQSEGEKWYTWYYENGFYYYATEGGECISFLKDVDIRDVEELSGDTFRVVFELISEDDGGSYSFSKEATLKAKEIDGQFQWSLVSYKTNASSQSSSSDQSTASSQSNSIEGSWEVNYDVTAVHNDNMNVQQAFGTSIGDSHGEMSINDDGTAEWYLGFEGGKGTYTFDGRQGTISYYDMNAESNLQVSIKKVSENGVDYLVMDCPFEEGDYYSIYWIRG